MAPNKTHFRKCKHEEHEDPSHPILLMQDVLPSNPNSITSPRAVPLRCRLTACLGLNRSFCHWWCYRWHSWTCKIPAKSSKITSSYNPEWISAWQRLVYKTPGSLLSTFYHCHPPSKPAPSQHILVLCVFLDLIARWYGLQSLDTL